MKLKKCLRCGQEKKLTDFGTSSRMPDGRYNWCRVCRPQQQAGRPLNPKFGEFKHLLGTMTDASLAKIVGVDSNTVSRWRQKEGIKSFQRERVGRPKKVKQPSVVTYYDLLGKVSDCEIARQFGISRQAVGQRRAAYGIQVCAKDKKP